MRFIAKLGLLMQKPLFILTIFLLYGCSSMRDSPKYQLGDDLYLFREKGDKYTKTYVLVNDDSIQLIDLKDSSDLQHHANADLYFLKQSFDFDVMTVAFKYRPATPALPRQLNTDFNGNIFLGYRLDRFKIKHQQTPAGIRKRYYHRGFTLGGFGGLGSTAMTPWTTNNMITDEYSGFIVTRGLAAMFGINSLTFGGGVGWDHLTDRDKSIWIYQNKPWFGLTVGLNLN